MPLYAVEFTITSKGRLSQEAESPEAALEFVQDYLTDYPEEWEEFSFIVDAHDADEITPQIKEETVPEYLVPFEVSVLDSLTVEANTQADATEKVRSHLLSYKDEWGKFDYSLDVKDPAPVDPPQMTNYYTVTQFGWANRGNEQFLSAHFNLESLFDTGEFNHGLVVETANHNPVAVAWVDVQLEDSSTGDSIIGWVNFRVLPSHESSEALIYSQTIAYWASSEPQLRLFAKQAPFYLGSRNSLLEAGFKYAGLKDRTAVLCHRAGDQALALEMARLRA